MKTASVDPVINRGVGSEVVAKTACFLPASVKICVVVLSRLLLLHFDWHFARMKERKHTLDLQFYSIVLTDHATKTHGSYTLGMCTT